MNLIHIDLPTARAALESVVEKYGSEHVGNCMFYVVEDGPGCLIGEALLHLGLSRNDFTDDINGLSIGSVAATLKMRAKVTFDNDALEYLTVAQDVQDDGKTWGDALGAAEGIVVEV